MHHHSIAQHFRQAVLEAEELRGRFAATAADLKLALSGLQASSGCRVPGCWGSLLSTRLLSFRIAQELP